ncbi:uncharacterized protein YALI1_B27615g [Yarrowia lipolytica]|uniref:Uncharacterized protein n=1 Tax=Yarrowia lipolytica TaxID=4952 RepID=A0A1D8N8Q8_YARLL|nr:hypothetical protein YALI1_B27615g [Yarrowia lipolytica]
MGLTGSCSGSQNLAFGTYCSSDSLALCSDWMKETKGKKTRRLALIASWTYWLFALSSLRALWFLALIASSGVYGSDSWLWRCNLLCTLVAMVLASMARTHSSILAYGRGSFDHFFSKWRLSVQIFALARLSLLAAASRLVPGRLSTVGSLGRRWHRWLGQLCSAGWLFALAAALNQQASSLLMAYDSWLRRQYVLARFSHHEALAHTRTLVQTHTRFSVRHCLGGVVTVALYRDSTWESFTHSRCDFHAGYI